MDKEITIEEAIKILSETHNIERSINTIWIHGDTTLSMHIDRIKSIDENGTCVHFWTDNGGISLWKKSKLMQIDIF